MIVKVHRPHHDLLQTWFDTLHRYLQCHVSNLETHIEVVRCIFFSVNANFVMHIFTMFLLTLSLNDTDTRSVFILFSQIYMIIQCLMRGLLLFSHLARFGMFSVTLLGYLFFKLAFEIHLVPLYIVTAFYFKLWLVAKTCVCLFAL